VDDDCIVIVVSVRKDTDGFVEEPVFEGEVDVHERRLVWRRCTGRRRVGIRGVAVELHGIHYSGGEKGLALPFSLSSGDCWYFQQEAISK
jgi:hypothetical protein